MLKNKIGVIVDSFRTPVKEGIKIAYEIGADGIQVYAVSGEMAPDNLTRKDRAEMKKYIESFGLEVSAICGDLGGHGFEDKNANPSKIEMSKRIIELAKDLGTDIVTTHIGVVPNDKNCEIYETMYKACYELGEFARSIDAYFALETGAETAAELKAFLDSLNTKGLCVNFDPANMVMVTGDDPVKGIELLKDYVVHTHVKDGIRVRPVDPRAIYGSLGYEDMDHEKLRRMVDEGAFFMETPLGEGHVDFDHYFAAIERIGYNGYLTIEREGGVNPAADIKKAVEFIKKYK
jgi:sugar phosphate isomerase/epimerase